MSSGPGPLPEINEAVRFRDGLCQVVFPVNRIVLVGRLVRNPELRYTQTGVPVATFTLAVSRPFANQQGEREADFIDVVVWRNQAENCSQYLSKGRMVGVDGRLQIRSYETADGQRRKAAEVVADRVEFLDRGREGPGPTGDFEPGIGDMDVPDGTPSFDE
ncbi:MAG TPA: single-stranded DNA-binding protein [Firmicutes bacterium]|nr:single-stranded DNA-binding protein [Bacillota bacterium]